MRVSRLARSLRGGLPSSSRGFTLIELVVVIAIIVILMGIVIGGMAWVERKKKESAAKVHIEIIAQGLERYFDQFQEYPSGAQDSFNKPSSGQASRLLYRKLSGDENGDGKPDSGNEILAPEMDPRNPESSGTWVKKSGASYVLEDPWGNPYRYRLGFNHNGNGENANFDLWSAGADGKDGTNDDIRNFSISQDAEVKNAKK